MKLDEFYDAQDELSLITEELKLQLESLADVFKDAKQHTEIVVARTAVDNLLAALQVNPLVIDKALKRLITEAEAA